MKRRKFLKTSGLASAGAMLVPAFLKPFESFAGNFLKDGNKTLVVIQLSGGNDGLNTVVPFANDNYYKLRSAIAIAQEEVIKLNDVQGLNPAMESLHELYDQGWMTIINSVGYPNPDRSHFRSMDIWHSASDSNEIINTGWLGRYLDSECETCKRPYNVIELDDSLSLAVKGETRKAIGLKNPQQLYLATRDSYFSEVSKSAPCSDHSNLGYLYKTLIETQSSAEYIFEKSKIFKSTTIFQPTAFSKGMKQIAELICSGLETRVYYVSLTGFDTHVNQKGQQNRLLKEYADGVAAFIKDMKKNDRIDDVLVMTFSEFGRRVAQNASSGTDHGTANNMFLYGGGLKKKGLYNNAPNLDDIEDGDLKYQVDFKNIYSTILDRWLSADVSKIINKKVELMDFI